MSSPRVQIVQAYFEALNKGDLERALAEFAPTAKFHTISRSNQAIPLVDGVAAYRQRRATRPVGEMQYEPGPFFEQKTCVMVKVGGKYTGPSKGDKEFLPINLSDVFRFNEENKIVESWVFE